MNVFHHYTEISRKTVFESIAFSKKFLLKSTFYEINELFGFETACIILLQNLHIHHHE